MSKRPFWAILGMELSQISSTIPRTSSSSSGSQYCAGWLFPVNLMKGMTRASSGYGEKEMKEALVDLAIEKGYKKGKTVHIVHDGDKVSF